MSMIEQFGEQFMEPMKGAIGDALNVAEENARRLRFALAALDGNYPGAISYSGTNGHTAAATAVPAQEVKALERPSSPPAPPPAPPPTPHEMDADRIDGRTTTGADLAEAVLRAAVTHGFIGLFGEPGVMKAAEVHAAMVRWGWRSGSMNPKSVVAASLAGLYKAGRADRMGDGGYIHAAAKGERIVLVDDDGQPVDPNAITIKELVRLVLVRANGEPMRPSEIVAVAVAAGWRNRTTHRESTVRSMASRLYTEDGIAERPGPGLYVIPKPVASAPAEPAEAPAEALEPEPVA